METKSIAEKVNSLTQSLGAERSMATVSSTVAKEFNVEANRMTLLRTTYDQSVNLKALIDGRQALVNGNQFSEEAISSLAKEAVSTAQVSPQDEANGFAISQGEKSFSFGSQDCNDEWMYGILDNLIKESKARFPKIISEGATVKFVFTDRVTATNDGTFLNENQGYYEGFVMFTAKEGKQSSSFNYIGFQLAASEAGKPLSLLEQANLQELYKQSSEQTKLQKVPSKFEGDVIVTPHCMSDLMSGWIMHLGPAMLLKGSSFFQGKLGQQVASQKWTLQSQPIDSKFASRKFWTQDGYLAKNETIFENGVLKNYLLDHYAAQKLKMKPSQSEGNYLKLSAGDRKFQDMVASVKKGVLLCRYSVGNPAENGDVSGVAKNSYYIENGQIQYPLGETMVAGNLAHMLLNIQDVSQETVSSGYWEFPWVRFSGMTVS